MLRVMCGRFAATATPDTLVEEYDIEFVDSLEPIVGPRWNVAPTSPVLTVQVEGDDGPRRTLGISRWGLTPSWAKQPMTLINARVETVTEKPSFRSAIRKRRCVVPADGYYEWREERDGGRKVKQPYFLRPEQGTLAMAGIQEFARFGDVWVRSTAILTTSATDATGWVHDRMPMVVPDAALAEWLDPGLTDGATAATLLEQPELATPYAVSRAVNKVGVEGEQLITPVGE